MNDLPRHHKSALRLQTLLEQHGHFWSASENDAIKAAQCLDAISAGAAVRECCEGRAYCV